MTPQDWAYTAARAIGLAAMFANVVLLFRIYGVKGVAHHRAIMSLSSSGIIAVQFLFSEGGWEPKPGAYFWFLFALAMLGAISFSSYRQARAAMTTEPEGAAS